jgi:hypothetical protein
MFSTEVQYLTITPLFIPVFSLASSCSEIQSCLTSSVSNDVVASWQLGAQDLKGTELTHRLATSEIYRPPSHRLKGRKEWI